MNDTINVLPHTTCQVSYCNKPLQPTTPEEDVDILIRRKRESALSPKPNADPNPYTTELLNLKQERTPTRKQEMQDPKLEEVLNKELTGLTLEDRVMELRLALEDDQAQRRKEKEGERELREREISGLMCYIGELQKEYRKGYKEVIGMLVTQVNDIREALSLFNRHMASQIKALSKQVAELDTQLMTQLSEYRRIIPDSTGSTRESSSAPFPPTIIPDSTESTRESSPVPLPPMISLLLLSITIPIGGIPAPSKIMSQCTFTAASGEIQYMTAGTAEEAAETLAKAERVARAEEKALCPTSIIPDSTDSTESTRESSLALLSPTSLPFPLRQHPTDSISIPESTESMRESSLALSPTLFLFPCRQHPIDPITTLTKPRVEPVVGISEKPSRDSYVEGNSPICNLGASGTPLRYSPYSNAGTPSTTEVIKPEEEAVSNKKEDQDRHMTNNADACQPGLLVSQHACPKECTNAFLA
ncbi:hypothetical protein L211DRAFT_851588 [Terfezia boudieri ATCC MYA-4762]|uniref:Uncharacterized protein n=1 Tax=Terfezia boudieri ATCC MYA-4762 TaxID=1051890 RepID=A0A3N4LES7_9PEZI|nr:hypothetical protein L211DRAFT_851588 [Terfezia boudieri ATCC MYA-4762]